MTRSSSSLKGRKRNGPRIADSFLVSWLCFSFLFYNIFSELTTKVLASKRASGKRRKYRIILFLPVSPMSCFTPISAWGLLALQCEKIAGAEDEQEEATTTTWSTETTAMATNRHAAHDRDPH